MKISYTASAACLAVVLFTPPSLNAVAKHHAVSLGKWITVQGSVEAQPAANNGKPSTLKVRPLLVDAQVKEFTFGASHDVTDRLFVVRRVFRINDSLPQESSVPPHWLWQRGGWLLVDRTVGRATAINLADFDAVLSDASWYRDYVAYCGVSDDGKKIFAVVSEISRRKPILKKILDGANLPEDARDANAGPACPAPAWQRNPSRVAFEAAGVPKQIFAIRGRAADLVTTEEDEEEASK